MNYSCMDKFAVAFALLTATVFLSAGCGVLITEPYTKTTVYDLGIPKLNNTTGIPIKINRFRMEGPYKSKMILRSRNNDLRVNDYKKWAQSPELMLTRYLKLALGSDSSGESRTSDTFSVSGTILVFEADEPSQMVSLVVDYAIKRSGVVRSLNFGRASFSTKITSVTSDSIASAMSKNAADFADLILKETTKQSKIK